DAIRMSTIVGADVLLKRLEADMKAQTPDITRRRLQLFLLGELKKWDELAAASRQAAEQSAKPDEKAVVLFLTASEQYMGGKHAESADNYRKVLQLEPDNVNALNNLAY